MEKRPISGKLLENKKEGEFAKVTGTRHPGELVGHGMSSVASWLSLERT